MTKIRNASLDQLDIEPQSYFLGGKEYPGVFKTEKGYGIRIMKKLCIGKWQRREEYDYFYTDEEGLIIESPRGMAKQYNKKIRIMDIETERQIQSQAK